MTATLWQHPAVYCTPDNDGTEVAAWMSRFGFKLAVQKLTEGLAVECTAEQWATWARPIRQAGLLAGAWSVHHLNPTEEVDTVYRLWAQGAKFDCLLLDVEDDYCYTGAYGAEHTAERNRVLMRGITLIGRVRAHFPRMPVGWNVLGNPGKDMGVPGDGSLYVHGAAQRAGFRLVPQCYPRQPGDGGASAAPRAADGFVAKGWPRSLIHPAVDAWLDPTGQQIRAELSLARLLGFFAFRYGMTSDDCARTLTAGGISLP